MSQFPRESRVCDQPQAPSRAGAITFFVLCLMAGVSCSAADELQIVTDAPIPPAASIALGDLERALTDRHLEFTRENATNDKTTSIIIGIPQSSAIVSRLLQNEKIGLSHEPESLCIHRITDGACKGLLIAGRDPRGLNYAIREVKRAIELAPKESDPLASVIETTEKPFLATRSLTIHLFNHDLDKLWYNDERFWEMYLSLLADSRFNNVTLTFADQSNYLCPPYAFLVKTPGFPNVTAEGLTDEARNQNLRTLRRITEMAHERGLDFTLGIWTQMPVAKFAGKICVSNLATGPASADYCAAGLGEVLRQCPGIDAVQLRMNAEAGVAEDQQQTFYHPLFLAIRDVGRRVRVDLRYKGLRRETIHDAVALGLNVTVSSKFWAEHMGLPYHPTAVDSHYSADRYSFGAMLEKPRPYHVIWRLWNVGSSRILLWGDPAYAAQFARNCKLGDGEGFEVFAPLTDKGFGNNPGDWKLFSDRTYDSNRWEIQRYWYLPLCFGRLGYNPDANPEIWQREFRHRFGSAAAAMESAYHSASQILPLITAAHFPSASEWS